MNINSDMLERLKAKFSTPYKRPRPKFEALKSIHPLLEEAYANKWPPRQTAANIAEEFGDHPELKKVTAIDVRRYNQAVFKAKTPAVKRSRSKGSETQSTVPPTCHNHEDNLI